MGLILACAPVLLRSVELISVGCATAHPLGVVLEIRADCLQSVRISKFQSSPFGTNCAIFQAVSQRRQRVFDELLAAYSASQKDLVGLKKKSDAQATKLQELTGKLVLATCLFMIAIALTLLYTCP